MKSFDDFYNNDDQRAAQAQYPIGYNRLHNGFDLNVDENGLVLDGIFKGKYLDRNACLGNEQFRKMTKTMDGIMTESALSTSSYLIRLLTGRLMPEMKQALLDENL
ncbi:MAG: hypothetical protein K6G06_07815 [Butyrivibrio sp.]|nr:hypothetical protein [Butyrivibrio sp.]